jgi:hypothetical protein
MEIRRMRTYSFTLLGMLIVLGLSGCAFPFGFHSPGSNIQIEWTDFVQFRGIRYVTQGFHSPSRSNQIKKENLGPLFSVVTFKVSGNISELGYQIKDGDAAFLDVGTKVFTVKGYQPWFRLAAYSHGTIMLYEVTENPKAKRGAELLDIDGKIRYISINSEQDGVTEIATIKDPQHVTTLITLIDNAPLRTQGSNREVTYFLALHFIDGTTFTRPYWAAPDNLFGALAMPKEFQMAIESAVHPKPVHGVFLAQLCMR